MISSTIKDAGINAVLPVSFFVMQKYLFKCHNSSSFFVPAESTGGGKYYLNFLNGNQTLAHVLGAVYFAVSSLANSIQSFVFGDGITISDTCSGVSPIHSQALEQSLQIIPPQAPFLYDECEAGLNRCLNDARRESVAHGYLQSWNGFILSSSDCFNA